VGDNEKLALQMMEEDFEYSTVFDCPKDICGAEKK
jgi:hypothetical protein